MIHELFIVHGSFYEEEGLKCNVALIILKIKNIIDIYIYIDYKYLWHIYILMWIKIKWTKNSTLS